MPRNAKHMMLKYAIGELTLKPKKSVVQQIVITKDAHLHVLILAVTLTLLLSKSIVTFLEYTVRD